MKANKILFVTALSLVTFQAMSPNEFLTSTKSIANRMPAAEEKNAQENEVIATATETEVVEAKSSTPPVVELVACKSESKGEKLEADIKKLLEDKESILKQIDGLKKENEDLKLKLTVAPEAKKQQLAPREESHKSENAEVILLMSQMTTMFSAQMQSQMQMQLQMMSIFSQMQNNPVPQMSPYAYLPSQFSNGQNFGHRHPNSYNGHPTLHDSIGLGAMDVGISAPASPWSDYHNPYSIMPSMTRQQLASPSDYGFSFNRPSPIQGFDFNQAPATFEQGRPELQKQQLSFPTAIISV